MLTEEHKKMAYNNLPTPRFDSIVDCAGYAWMRYVYQQFKAGLIARELAEMEIAACMKWDRDFCDANKFELRWIATTADRMKATEAAMSAYGMCRTLENADRLWAVLNGIIWEAIH